MIELRVTEIGNSLGVVIPADALDALQLRNGDRLLMTMDEQGFRVSVLDAAVTHQVEVAEGVIRRYAQTLNRLAK